MEYDMAAARIEDVWQRWVGKASVVEQDWVEPRQVC
jgi:hypothetical protein